MDCCKHILGFSIIKLLLISCVLGKEGVCRRTVRHDDRYVTEVYCCTNFEMRNGTCIMCREGFVTKDGDTCQACTGNAYGTQCLLSCSCTAHQICHHVAGCITLQSTIFETSFEDSTAVSKLLTTSNIEVEERESTESNHGQPSFDQNILIYSVCIAGLLVVFTICIICFNRHRYKTAEQKDVRNRQATQIQNASNIISPIPENMTRHESVYDEIDEVSLNHDVVLPKRLSISYDESSFEETSGSGHDNLKNEDYLNPYQPIVKDHERHYYNNITENTGCNNLATIEVNGTGHESNGEIAFENATNMHEYINVIDLSLENLIKDCNSSNSELVNIQENINQGTSQINIFLSKKYKPKHVGVVQDDAYPVAIKRLTI